MSRPHLIYFDGRGRGETARLMLAAAQAQFDQTFVTTREQFLQLIKDDKLMFEQIPYLKWGDIEVVQSGSIVRFIAKKSGMMGTNLEEETMIDQLFMGTVDFLSKFVAVGFAFTPAQMKVEAENVILPKSLPIFEKVLAKNGTGYLVGNSFTLADGGLLETLLAVEEYCGADTFKPYSNIKKYLVTMHELPGIQNYMKNVRKPKNSFEYVSTVHKVLGRVDMEPTF